MKIIHVALNAPGQPQLGLKLALASLGEVSEIDWLKNRHGVGRVLVQRVQEFRPDLVFMQLQTDGVIPWEDLTTIRQSEPKPFVINWTGDVRHPTPRHYFQVGREIDLTLFTNLNDIESLRAEGMAADYLQIGFDEEAYAPQGSRGQWPSVVFLGNNYGRRFPLSWHRSEMATRLRAMLREQFSVYGSGWKFPARSLNESQEAECYRSCQIAIHQSHYSYGRYFSDRLLRAMGSGAFVLAHRWPGMEHDFIEGEHLATWGTFGELAEKVWHYLNAADERQRIAAAGCELVRSEHTWMARVPRLLQLAGLEGAAC